VISGGNGNDTYVFGRGDGQDTIQSKYDSSSTKLNVLRFKEGVSTGDVTATRSGDNIVLGIAGSSDQVTVSSFYSAGSAVNNYNPLQQLVFTDGTAWSLADIDNKVKGLPVASTSAQTASTDRQAEALVAAMASFSGSSATTTGAVLPSYSGTTGDAPIAAAIR
ncbi:calcium-binding protein, partial [Roseateles sp.]|uniref:calcium-binding protein n=1 Tax=Roseateles sp. TaxID=1971397 RepID=UPI0031DB067C